MPCPSLQRQLDMVAVGVCVLAVIITYVSTLWWHDKDNGDIEHYQRLLGLLGPVGLWAWLATSTNSNYIKFRSFAVIMVKLIFFGLPTMRAPSSFYRLNSLPKSSILSTFIIEPIKILVGAKILALNLSAAAMPLPLSLHIPLQFLTTLLVRNNAVLCSTSLLSSPAYHDRILDAAYLLQLLPQSLAGGPLGVPESAQDRCRAIATFAQIILGVLGSTIVLVKMAPPVVVEACSKSNIDRFLLNCVSKICNPSHRLQEYLPDYSEPMSRLMLDLQQWVIWWGILALVWVLAINVL